MSFTCMRMKNDFRIKGWATTLVLKQRPGETRKWPIEPLIQPKLCRRILMFHGGPLILVPRQGKIALLCLFPWVPARLNLTPIFPPPKKHINSDWVRVWAPGAPGRLNTASLSKGAGALITEKIWSVNRYFFLWENVLGFIVHRLNHIFRRFQQ